MKLEEKSHIWNTYLQPKQKDHWLYYIEFLQVTGQNTMQYKYEQRNKQDIYRGNTKGQ